MRKKFNLTPHDLARHEERKQRLQARDKGDYIPSITVHRAAKKLVEDLAMNGDREAAMWILERTMPKAAPGRYGVMTAPLTEFAPHEEITPASVGERMRELANVALTGCVSLDVVGPVQNILTSLLNVHSEMKAQRVLEKLPEYNALSPEELDDLDEV